MAVKPIKVSQINQYIKRILQSDPVLGNVSVTGEVSNLKYHGTGHVYFTLKDEESKLSCFLPAEYLRQIRYELEDGMEIIATGFISVFERGGTYSLTVKDVDVSGLGNLSLAFGKLKEKLQKEGLFDSKHKQQIPTFPRLVVVVTSETGAAVQDILKIIQSRNTIVDVIVYPCLVQGPSAAAEIAEAVRSVNQLFPETDTIILGRGGGSMEELWAFNEEIVARSIFASRIPIISAVGHETDFTIADFVADFRAETPTAAAQIAVPDTVVLRDWLDKQYSELDISLEKRIQLLQSKISIFDVTSLQQALVHRMSWHQARLEGYQSDLLASIQQWLTERTGTVEGIHQKLLGLNPDAIMERGYAAILNENGTMVGSIDSFTTGDGMTAILKDGSLACTVNTKTRRMRCND